MRKGKKRLRRMQKRTKQPSPTTRMVQNSVDADTCIAMDEPRDESDHLHQPTVRPPQLDESMKRCDGTPLGILQRQRQQHDCCASRQQAAGSFIILPSNLLVRSRRLRCPHQTNNPTRVPTSLARRRARSCGSCAAWSADTIGSHCVRRRTARASRASAARA